MNKLDEIFEKEKGFYVSASILGLTIAADRGTTYLGLKTLKREKAVMEISTPIAKKIYEIPEIGLYTYCIIPFPLILLGAYQLNKITRRWKKDAEKTLNHKVVKNITSKSINNFGNKYMLGMSALNIVAAIRNLRFFL